MQAIYYLPIETPVTVDKEVSLTGYHDEYSLWFQLINESMYVDSNVLFIKLHLLSHNCDIMFYLQSRSSRL